MPQFVCYYNCALRILFCVFQFLAIVNGLPLIDLQFKDSPSETNSASVATKSHGDLMFEYWVPSERPETKEGPGKWNYREPSAWSSLFSKCGGDKQSPIDIQPRSTVLKSYSKFAFNNYGYVDNMILTNNGKTALFSLPTDYPKSRIPYITGGGLEGKFEFVQFHLHWGSDSTKGSEHLIQSKSYPAELHLVHYNTKYPSFVEATRHSDGLAVLGIFIKVSREDNVSLKPLVDQLDEVRREGSTNLKFMMPFQDMLPDRTSSFFRYDGALTTPSCDQIVIWTVFKNPITMSENQLSKFRRMVDDDGGSLVNNFRPTLPLNNRIVTYRSFSGCEISRSWPFTSSPFSQAFIWSQCLISYAFNSIF